MIPNESVTSRVKISISNGVLLPKTTSIWHYKDDSTLFYIFFSALCTLCNPFCLALQGERSKGFH